MSSVLMSLCTADVTPNGDISATIRMVSVAPEHARLLETLGVGVRVGEAEPPPAAPPAPPEPAGEFCLTDDDADRPSVVKIRPYFFKARPPLLWLTVGYKDATAPACLGPDKARQLYAELGRLLAAMEAQS